MGRGFPVRRLFRHQLERQPGRSERPGAAAGARRALRDRPRKRGDHACLRCRGGQLQRLVSRAPLPDLAQKLRDDPGACRRPLSRPCRADIGRRAAPARAARARRPAEAEAGRIRPRRRRRAGDRRSAGAFCRAAGRAGQLPPAAPAAGAAGLPHRLLARGGVAGLRIDHIDGLYDPRAYCERLRQRVGQGLYLVVEKILARYETLPDWPVAGTTGYDFLNQVLALFVDPAGEAAMTRIYRRLAGRGESFDEVLYAAKQRIMQVTLASEISVLADEFHQLSMREWRTRDFTLNGIRAALTEVIAAFPVYRTYVSRRGAGVDDRRYIEWALAQAKKRWAGPDLSIFDFLHDVLTARLADPRRHSHPQQALRAAMHFQQVTGPVMAKSLEDTAFYRYARLLALNEVGGDPRRFGMSVAAFHHLMQERRRTLPNSMVTTATHDTKRGEDARLRLALLAEMPQEWERRVLRWLRLNRSRRREVAGMLVPDRNLEYLFYQALLGAWPPALDPADADGMRALAARMAAYMIKAVREAKEVSSWSNPDGAYEAALEGFVRGVLDTARPNPFLAEFHEFVAALARPAAIASLAQLVLKLTVPGVPDIYQGGELWDFSLVDPDNRGAVDWEARARLSEAVAGATPADFAAQWRDGREKLFVIRRLLDLRRRHPGLFAEGDYQPLAVAGDNSAHLCALARSRGAERLVVAVPRLLWRLYRDGAAAWGDTALALPPGPGWHDVFAGRRLAAAERIGAGALLAMFPVAVLIAEPG